MEQFQDLSESWNKCKETIPPPKKIAHCVMLCLKPVSHNVWELFWEASVAMDVPS